MKLFLGVFLLAFLCSCSSGDYAAATELDTSVKGVNTNDSAVLDSVVVDKKQVLIHQLVNTRFQNVVSNKDVLSREFSEGLEILELREPSLYSPGNGVVSVKDSNHIQLIYRFYENAKMCKYVLSMHNVRSDYKQGDTLLSGVIIGHAILSDDKYTLAIDSWTDSPFEDVKWPITSLDSKTGYEDPNQIKNLIIVHKSDYHFYYYIDGHLKHEFEIALGQAPSGHKKVQGDNRTPEGRYLIVEKMKGPFDSPTGPWLGDSWFRLNYPNKWDAEIGYKDGLITKGQMQQIVRAYDQKRDTPNNTKLGGHIGIHGWNGDWYQYGSHDITWGCVSMRNHQIDDIYDEIPVGTVVYIMP